MNHKVALATDMVAHYKHIPNSTYARKIRKSYAASENGNLFHLDFIIKQDIVIYVSMSGEILGRYALISADR